MDLSQIVSNGSSTGQSAAQQQLSGDFSTFLTMLTTQLKNQDPTSPMDSNQFTQELVEFSGVEQQINTNDNLKNLISLTQGSIGSSAVNYLGKTVTVTNGNASFNAGSTTTWNYALNGQAASTTLTVTDANGNVVYTQQGGTEAGAHELDWNGQDNAGNTVPDGTYTLHVSAQAADGTQIMSAVASKGIVTEVDMSGSVPELIIGSMKVPLSDISVISST